MNERQFHSGEEIGDPWFISLVLVGVVVALPIMVIAEILVMVLR